MDSTPLPPPEVVTTPENTSLWCTIYGLFYLSMKRIVYVGHTMRDPKKRGGEHFKLASGAPRVVLTFANNRFQPLASHFKFEILWQGECTLDYARAMEQVFINKYDTLVDPRPGDEFVKDTDLREGKEPLQLNSNLACTDEDLVKRAKSHLNPEKRIIPVLSPLDTKKDNNHLSRLFLYLEELASETAVLRIQRHIDRLSEQPTKKVRFVDFFVMINDIKEAYKKEMANNKEEENDEEEAHDEEVDGTAFHQTIKRHVQMFGKEESKEHTLPSTEVVGHLEVFKIALGFKSHIPKPVKMDTIAKKDVLTDSILRWTMDNGMFLFNGKVDLGCSVHTQHPWMKLRGESTVLIPSFSFQNRELRFQDTGIQSDPIRELLFYVSCGRPKPAAQHLKILQEWKASVDEATLKRHGRILGVIDTSPDNMSLIKDNGFAHLHYQPPNNGIQCYPHGVEYHGKFDKDERRCGEGKLEVKDDWFAKGTWKDGKLNGSGTKRVSNGLLFEGTFKDHWLVNGKVTFPNGEVWEGEFSAFFMKKGKKTFPDGEVHEGIFSMNAGGIPIDDDFVEPRRYCNFIRDARTIPDGALLGNNLLRGKVTFPDARTYDGDFRNGGFLHGRYTSPSGEVQVFGKEEEQSHRFAASLDDLDDAELNKAMVDAQFYAEKDAEYQQTVWQSYEDEMEQELVDEEEQAEQREYEEEQELADEEDKATQLPMASDEVDDHEHDGTANLGSDIQQPNMYGLHPANPLVPPVECNHQFSGRPIGMVVSQFRQSEATSDSFHHFGRSNATSTKELDFSSLLKRKRV